VPQLGLGVQSVRSHLSYSNQNFADPRQKHFSLSTTRATCQTQATVHPNKTTLKIQIMEVLLRKLTCNFSTVHILVSSAAFCSLKRVTVVFVRLLTSRHKSPDRESIHSSLLTLRILYLNTNVFWTAETHSQRNNTAKAVAGLNWPLLSTHCLHIPYIRKVIRNSLHLLQVLMT
jgi:hypothetical protein